MRKPGWALPVSQATSKIDKIQASEISVRPPDEAWV
jgi:hypothetical protein